MLKQNLDILVLDIVSHDYENYNAILSDVRNEPGCADVESSTVIESLQKSITDGYIDCYKYIETGNKFVAKSFDVRFLEEYYFHISMLGVENLEANEARDTREVRDEQGRLIAQAEYQNGKLDGVSRIWNPGGILIQEAYFKHGMREGSYRTWWDNGQLKEEGFYSKDAKVGLYIWYDDDGSVISRHDYGDGIQNQV